MTLSDIENPRENSGDGTARCSGCGAELSPGVFRISSVCPLCRRPLSPAAGRRKDPPPGDSDFYDCVIPFSFGPGDLAQEYAKLKAMPDECSRSITENTVRKIYLPFWIYDLEVTGETEQVKRFPGGGRRRVNRRQGDERPENSENPGKIRARLVYRNIPELAVRIPDPEILRVIAPEDLVPDNPEPVFSEKAYRKAVRAGTALPDLEQARALAETEISAYMAPGGSGVRNQNIAVRPLRIRTLLFPVLFAKAAVNGQDCIAVMNGDAGEFYTNIPADPEKLRLMRSALTLMFAGLLTVSWWLAPFILGDEDKGSLLARLVVECCGGSFITVIILAFVFGSLDGLLTDIRGFRLVSYTLSVIGILIITVMAVINLPGNPGGFLTALACAFACAFAIRLIGVHASRRKKAFPRFAADVSRYRSREECSLSLPDLNLNREATGSRHREP